ncbi:MAG: DUF4255 domain-containing protein [Gemmatimonadales bacterium]
MSNTLAVHSVGQSLMTYLANVYPASLKQDFPCDFRLVSSGELATNEDFGTALTLYLYRITMNEHLRNAPRQGPGGTQVPLSVDLHFLLSAWADKPLAEHTTLAWAMQQLQQRPLLELSSLSPEADWESTDYVQVIPAELSTEDIMRIWDALDPSYRLSVSYIARVIRIDGAVEPDARPVAARRLIHQAPAGSA